MIPPQIAVGRKIGNWRLVRFLGGGRSGVVFEVQEIVSPYRIGAVKLHCGPGIRASPEEFEREMAFVRAQPIRGYMPRHYDDGQVEGIRYFVMEPARPLPKKPSPRQTRRIIARIARALELLHDAKWIHCDVKPPNVGLVNGKAVLLDYGSVRRIGDEPPDPARVGTWKYMAPEVREVIRLDPRIDVYSLGVTLEELCHGSAGRTYEGVIVRACNNDADERHQSMREFRREFLNAKDRLAKFKIASLVALLVTGIALYSNHQVKQRIVEKKMQLSIGLRRDIAIMNGLAKSGLHLAESKKYAEAAVNLSRAIEHPDFDQFGYERFRVYSTLAFSIDTVLVSQLTLNAVINMTPRPQGSCLAKKNTASGRRHLTHAIRRHYLTGKAEPA